MSNVPENQQLKAALQAVIDHYVNTNAEVGVLLCQELFADPDGALATDLREHHGIEAIQLVGYLEAQQRVANNAESQQPGLSAREAMSIAFAAVQPFSNSESWLSNNPAQQLIYNSESQQPDEPNTYYVKPTPRSTVEPTQTVLNWCAEHGWIDPYWEPEHDHPVRGAWWAFKGTAMMATPLPDAAQTGRFDPVGTQLSPDGCGELQQERLYAIIFGFLRDCDRRNLNQPRLGASSFVGYFDFTLNLLQQDETVRLMNWAHEQRVYGSVLNFGFTRLRRVSSEMPSMFDESLTMAELGVCPQRLALELADDHQLALWLLARSIEILRHFNLTPHPRWYVGTTEQSNRGFDSGIPTTEINQRDTYVSSPYQCGWNQ